MLTAKQISHVANDIIYDPKTQKIYASIPGSPGSIRSSDPTTGDIGPPIPVGNELLKLAISDNGQFLYVGLDGEGAVQRVDLTTQTAGQKFILGSDPTLAPYYVEDLQTLPGSPTSVAVSRKYKGVFPKKAGIVIFDNGIPRSKIVQYFQAGNSIAFADTASTLYGCDNEGAGDFLRMVVKSSSVSILDSTSNLLWFSGTTIKYYQGPIYSSWGEVVDPVTLSKIGGYQIPHSLIPGEALPVIDPEAGTITFMAQGSGFGGPVDLIMFNRSTFQEVGRFRVGNVSGAADTLIRWGGGKGMAFQTDNEQVTLIFKLVDWVICILIAATQTSS